MNYCNRRVLFPLEDNGLMVDNIILVSTGTWSQDEVGRGSRMDVGHYGGSRHASRGAEMSDGV